MSCGGSTELITMLNRFGICSSVDTLKRVIHSVSLDRKNAGTRSLLVEKAFTVASTDNIDFLRVMLLYTRVTSTVVGMPLAFSLFNRCLTQPSIVSRAG